MNSTWENSLLFFFYKTLDYVSKEKYEIKGISDFIMFYHIEWSLSAKHGY